MFVRFLIYSLFAASILSFFSSFSQAEDFLIPPMESKKANNATFNIDDAIESLRDGGFIKRALQLEALLQDGRLYYQYTGNEKADNSAHTSHADSSPDGKTRIRFGRHHVSNDVFGPGEEPTRYKGAPGKVYRYLTVKTALHELAHAEQSLKFIQDGNFKGVLGGPLLHELDAYRKSLKQFADVFVIKDLRDYLDLRNSYSQEDRGERLLLLQAKVYALNFGLNGKQEVGPIGAARDKACRWRSIAAELDKLFNDLPSLRRDAESRAECEKNPAHYLQQGQTAVTELTKLTDAMKILGGDLAELDKKLQQSLGEYSLLGAELQNRKTTQSRRLEIAGRFGDIDRYLSQTKPRYNRLKAKYLTMEKKRQSFQKQIQFSRRKQAETSNGFDKCRIGFITRAMKEKPFPQSQLPPDMIKTKTGKIKLLPKNKKRQIDIAASAALLESMFDYDPEKLNQADDPRTPCYKPTIKLTKPQKTQKKQKKTAVKFKKVCTGGGLVAAMNCVTIRIEEGN